MSVIYVVGGCIVHFVFIRYIGLFVYIYIYIWMDRVGLVLFDGKLFAAAVAVEWYCTNPTSHRHKKISSKRPNGCEEQRGRSCRIDSVAEMAFFFRLFKKKSKIK